MYIVSTFEHSNDLESAITAIQMKGIAKKDILAVPLDKRGESKMLFDTTHASDGLSLLDLPVVLGTILTLLGSIYGFVLPWGPILCGAIGFFVGFGIGLLVKIVTMKKYNHRQKDKKASEVVLLIACSEGQMETVQEMLWANSALGVSKLSLE
jgi:hypothetical protein